LVERGHVLIDARERRGEGVAKPAVKAGDDGEAAHRPAPCRDVATGLNMSLAYAQRARRRKGPPKRWNPSVNGVATTFERINETRPKRRAFACFGNHCR
jgi:hypothetical protein